MKNTLRRILSTIYVRCFANAVQLQIEQHVLLRSHIFGGDISRLEVAPTANVLNALFNVSSGTIRVEENVFFGHNVCVLTGWHDPSMRGAERQDKWADQGHDIVIREGAWLASNVTVIGPAEIGAYAVIAAGAVVRGNIPARVLAGGIPARVIKEI